MSAGTDDDDVIDLTLPDALERLEAAAAAAAAAVAPAVPHTPCPAHVTYCVDDDDDSNEGADCLSVPWAATPPPVLATATTTAAPTAEPAAPATTLLRTHSELVDQVARPLRSEDSVLSQAPRPRARPTSEDALPVLLLGPGADPTGAVEAAVRQGGFETRHTDFAVP